MYVRPLRHAELVKNDEGDKDDVQSPMDEDNEVSDKEDDCENDGSSDDNSDNDVLQIS